MTNYYLSIILQHHYLKTLRQANPELFCCCFCQIGNELERNLLTEQLLFLYGEGLMKEPRRLDTLVNVLEFSYTNWANNGAGTATLKVNSRLGARTWTWR